MRNTILLIFSLILLSCNKREKGDNKQNATIYKEFDTYLEAQNIPKCEDTCYYIILPASCITCKPWLSSDKGKDTKKLHLITANPKRYFTNFISVFEDPESNFMDLSFNKFGPLLVQVITSKQECSAEQINTISQLKKVIPNF